MWVGWLVWLAGCDALHEAAAPVDAASPPAIGTGEAPCAGGYEANTQLALAKEQVVVDRFYDDGRRETVRVPLDAVDRLAVESIPQGDGRACSVIWLHRTDGSRLIFDDDAEADLTPRARELGAAMGRPVDVEAAAAPRDEG